MDKTGRPSWVVQVASGSTHNQGWSQPALRQGLRVETCPESFVRAAGQVVAHRKARRPHEAQLSSSCLSQLKLLNPLQLEWAFDTVQGLVAAGGLRRLGFRRREHQTSRPKNVPRPGAHLGGRVEPLPRPSLDDLDRVSKTTMPELLWGSTASTVWGSCRCPRTSGDSFPTTSCWLSKQNHTHRSMRHTHNGAETRTEPTGTSRTLELTVSRLRAFSRLKRPLAPQRESQDDTKRQGEEKCAREW